ncbi:MAG: S1C family serine protease [bacterium]
MKDLNYFVPVILVALSALVLPMLGTSSLLANPVNAIVGLEVKIPVTARTAASLGANRRGSGIVIDDEGRVLTIGYLILEASKVSLVDVDGKTIPATVIGYDGDTGFGIVQALTPLQAEPVALGDSTQLKVGSQLKVVSREIDSVLQEVIVMDRENFAGYWEYLLEDALFTTPAVPSFAGAGLINDQGELVGIGSLFVRRPFADQLVPANMFVPIEALQPILSELIRQGQISRPPKPWLGVTVVEQYGRVLVQSVSKNSPASQAGLAEGDLLLKINDKAVSDLEELFRAIWGQGEAGVRIPMTILKGNQLQQIEVVSADRRNFYRLQRYD